MLPPAHLRVGFSLVDELNVRIHWRNAQRRLLALAGESLAHDAPLARRLQRIDAAVQEFEVYRKWVLACAAPPLAFSGRVDRDEVIAQMIKWVAREVDSVVAGEALAPPSTFEQARNEARVREAYQEQLRQAQRWRGELAAEEAALRRLDAAISSGGSAATGGTAPTAARSDRAFWLPLLRCDPFGVDAPKSGYNRRYQAWLGELLLRPDDEDRRDAEGDDADVDAGGDAGGDAPVAAPPSKKRAARPEVRLPAASSSSRHRADPPPAAFGLGGSAYNGDLPARRDPSKWTIEHVVPREWCRLTTLVDETVDVLHNVHLIGLATAAENASRGAKPLSFVTYESLRKLRASSRRSGPDGRGAASRGGPGPGGGPPGGGEQGVGGAPTAPGAAGWPRSEASTPTYDPTTMAAYLYDPRGFSEARKAAAARVTACAFLTYPLLSDAPSYAGWPTGRIGSALYGAQWAHIRRLLLEVPPTEWEQRLDWIRWYRYGWTNPLVHDVGALTGSQMQHRLLVGVETLLQDRLRGADALGELLYETVVGGRDVELEAAQLEAELEMVEERSVSESAANTVVGNAGV